MGGPVIPYPTYLFTLVERRSNATVKKGTDLGIRSVAPIKGSQTTKTFQEFLKRDPKPTLEEIRIFWKVRHRK